MTDDERDRRRVKTPPAGVRAQTAAPLEETWSDDEVSKSHGAPPSNPREMAETVQKIHERSKLSTAASLKTLNATNETLSRVDAVRLEMKQDIVAVNEKVDAVSSVVSDLRVDVKGVAVAFNALAESYNKDRDIKTTMHITERTADIEIGKADKLAEIEIHKTDKLVAIGDRSKWSDTWRATVLKIVGAIVVAMSAFLAGRC